MIFVPCVVFPGLQSLVVSRQHVSSRNFVTVFLVVSFDSMCVQKRVFFLNHFAIFGFAGNMKYFVCNFAFVGFMLLNA